MATFRENLLTRLDNAQDNRTGKAIDDSRSASKIITVRMRRDEFERIGNAAHDNRVSKNQFILQSVLAAIDAIDDENKADAENS